MLLVGRRLRRVDIAVAFDAFHVRIEVGILAVFRELRFERCRPRVTDLETARNRQRRSGAFQRAEDGRAGQLLVGRDVDGTGAYAGTVGHDGDLFQDTGDWQAVGMAAGTGPRDEGKEECFFMVCRSIPGGGQVHVLLRVRLCMPLQCHTINARYLQEQPWQFSYFWWRRRG